MDEKRLEADLEEIFNSFAEKKEEEIRQEIIGLLQDGKTLIQKLKLSLGQVSLIYDIVINYIDYMSLLIISGEDSEEVWQGLEELNELLQTTGNGVSEIYGINVEALTSMHILLIKWLNMYQEKLSQLEQFNK